MLLVKSVPQAFYYNFIDQGRYDGGAMLATLAAQDHMYEIANSINRLNYDIHSVMASEQDALFCNGGGAVSSII